MFCALLLRTVKWLNAVGHSLQLPRESEHSIAIRLRNYNPRYLPKINENTQTCTSMTKATLFTVAKEEITKMTINQLIDKQNTAYLYN